MKAALLLVFCAVLLAGCTSKPPKPEMPAIDDPAQLATDCTALQADTTIHAIPKEKWPDSVAKLDPVSVLREGNGIYIRTFEGPDGHAKGYVFAIFKPGDSAHYKISDSPYSRIYRFDFTP